MLILVLSVVFLGVLDGFSVIRLDETDLKPDMPLPQSLIRLLKLKEWSCCIDWNKIAYPICRASKQAAYYLEVQSVKVY